ncbi:gag-pol polyprotein [Tanacetum coccineum]|uniref:Gag-pol polyprotein n=1 Tax=Tanacetum coccineum TaxID=301880 RepID=A0ABQ5DQI2_9ASTR
MEPGFSGSHNHGNVASTSEDGNALCCEAAVANESRKRFADVWLFNTGATFYMTARRDWFHQYKPISRGGSVYSCNDQEVKIIRIRSIMVKMHDGTVHTIEDVRHLKGGIIKEVEASVASHSPSHRVAVTWHQKLGHMSEQAMKILMERKLLPGLTKNWFTLICGKHQFNPWEEQSILYPSLMIILGDVRQLDQGCNSPPDQFLIDLEWERVTKMIPKEFEGPRWKMDRRSEYAYRGKWGAFHREAPSRHFGLHSSFFWQFTAAKLMLLVYKLLLLVLEVNAASIKVTAAQRLRLLKEFLVSRDG